MMSPVEKQVFGHEVNVAGIMADWDVTVAEYQRRAVSEVVQEVRCHYVRECKGAGLSMLNWLDGKRLFDLPSSVEASDDLRARVDFYVSRFFEGERQQFADQLSAEICKRFSEVVVTMPMYLTVETRRRTMRPRCWSVVFGRWV